MSGLGSANYTVAATSSGVARTGRQRVADERVGALDRHQRQHRGDDRLQLRLDGG
jgi:hypothetical protein